MNKQDLNTEYSLLREEEIENLLAVKEEKDKCQICDLNESKYKCPNCLLKTCSLICCKKHKNDLNCDGKYHHEKYIKQSEMDDHFLQKDLTFLQEMIRESDNAKKRLSNLKNQEQLRFKLLRIYSKKLFNIKLKIAPQILTIHRENLSFYHTKSKKIFWTIAIIFCICDNRKEQIRILLDPIEDDTPLSKVMDKIPTDNSNLLILLKEKTGTTKIQEAITDRKLIPYICNDDDPRTPSLRVASWETPIAEAIKDLTITEFPAIKIIFLQDVLFFESSVKVIRGDIS